MSFNAADERQVKERKRNERDAREVQQDDLRELLALPAFRRYVLNLIIGRCNMLGTAESPNGSPQSSMIGRQNVGRELWAEIGSVDPLAIPRMMIEHHESQS
jgi:hypothetical protein